MVDKPWDLIAACIAWLRADSAVATAFGEGVGSTGKRKFVSDYAPPLSELPYAVFNEPSEVENYETTDSRGPSSLAAGVFVVEVFADEKLRTRRLADRLAASLNDAPLTFMDGVLIHLRRSERKFPTFKAAGPDGGATVYKRVLEFEYLIERYI